MPNDPEGKTDISHLIKKVCNYKRSLFCKENKSGTFLINDGTILDYTFKCVCVRVILHNFCYLEKKM